MKSLVVSLFVILVGVSASAVNSISVTVDGLTYACTGGSNDLCGSKLQALNTSLSGCVAKESAPWCISTLWPTFKKNNPNCLEEGAAVCADICMRKESAPWCISTCR